MKNFKILQPLLMGLALFAFICFSTCPLVSCKKEIIREYFKDTIEIRTIIRDSIIVHAPDSLGKTIMNLKKDTIYKATSDGFLSVQLSSDIFGKDIYITIYSDENPQPATKAAVIYYSGAYTFPIRKNNYWKVSARYPFYTELNIAWTPLEKAQH
jgi:hypothetical protein